jgi:hypothetical protein
MCTRRRSSTGWSLRASCRCAALLGLGALLTGRARQGRLSKGEFDAYVKNLLGRELRTCSCARLITRVPTRWRVRRASLRSSAPQRPHRRPAAQRARQRAAGRAGRRRRCVGTLGQEGEGPRVRPQIATTRVIAACLTRVWCWIAARRRLNRSPSPKVHSAARTSAHCLLAHVMRSARQAQRKGQATAGTQCATHPRG